MSNISKTLPLRQESSPGETPDKPFGVSRRHRAQALVPTVRSVFGGFRVGSSRRDADYLVTRPDRELVCACPDFQMHREQADFRCKHIWAVEMAQQDGGAIPSGQSPGIQPQGPVAEERIRLKVIKNTKGYCWEITVVDEDGLKALSQVRELESKIKAEYGLGEPSLFDAKEVENGN